MDSTQHEISKTEEINISSAMEDSNSSNDCMTFSKLEDVPHFINNNSCNDAEEETMSFIVLGKDSLDAIQASSLASYVDIQQKSMSIDYTSMISSLATNEIHQKLAELLQENTKLKETLKQNNTAMKKQLTTMVSWQDMVMNLHENHKEKFKETANLINNLKKENLELKTRLAMQQTKDMEHSFEAIDAILNFNSNNTLIGEAISQENKFILEEKKCLLPNSKEPAMQHSFEAIDVISNFNSNTTLIDKAISQEAMSTLEEKKCLLSNDKESEPAMQQTAGTKHNPQATDTISTIDSNNVVIEEVVPQEESSTSSLKEEKHSFSNKQHICQCSCENLKKEIDYYKNMYHFQKLANDYTKQNIIEQELPLENCEGQTSDEHSTDDNSTIKIQKSDPVTDHMYSKLIYSIDKCEIGPAHWNDKDYESNRTRYNSLIRELVKNSMEIVNRYKAITDYLQNIATIFASVEGDINKGTFENNLKSLKQKCIQYKTEASAYKQLTHPDISHLTFKFCDALNNVQDHICNIFVDYRETLYMMHLMMDESLKIGENEHDSSDDNLQKQIEVQEKLKLLATQHSKMQKEKEELEELRRELNALSESLNSEKSHMRDVQILQDQLLRRKNLYNGKIQALLKERRLLMRDQKIDSADLLQKYKQKSLECESLQCQLDETISDIGLYKSQLSMYEEDFKQERNLKESLLEEKNKLNDELQKQVMYNKQLADRLTPSDFRSVSENASKYSNKEIMQPCPKCGLAFATLQSLTEHVELCLNLNLETS